MGLFGRKKSPEEILAEGRTQYENGDLKKAFLTLHGLAGKGDPQACYYVGRIYLERKEKSLAQSFLIKAAKGSVPDAAVLLAKEFDIRDYLPQEELPAQPAQISAPLPQADGRSSVDDLLEELEETGEFIQETKRELKQAEKKVEGLRKVPRPKPREVAEKPLPLTPAAPAVRPAPVPRPAPEKKQASQPMPEKKHEPVPASRPERASSPAALPAPPPPAPKTKRNPALVNKPDERLSQKEKYQKGMELFWDGKYEQAFKLLQAVCDMFYAGPYTYRNIYPAGQAALGWMCETGNGTQVDTFRARVHYNNAIDNATGIPDKNGMAGIVRLTARSESLSLKDCETALDYIKQIDSDETKAVAPKLEKRLAEASLREKYMEWTLSDDNVSAVFNQCLATKDTPDDDVRRSVLFKDGNEYSAVTLCKSKIEQNKRKILYLMGQLDSIHSGFNFIFSWKARYRYGGTLWAVKEDSVGKLYHLAQAANFMAPSEKERSQAITKPIVTPTLSPQDPEFFVWWEAHKDAWENPEKFREKLALEEKREKREKTFAPEKKIEAAEKSALEKKPGKGKELPVMEENTGTAEIAGNAPIFVVRDDCLTVSICGLCMFACKQEAIVIDKDRVGVSIDLQGCTKCGACVEVCPVSAIHIRQQ